MLHDMVTMNLPLDEKLTKDLEDLAKRTGKPVEEILADAAREHVDYTQRLLADVDQGRREIADGRFLTSDEVRQDLARRRQERQR